MYNLKGNLMGTPYASDVVAWSNEQARLIRSGQFDQLDLEDRKSVV